MTKSNGIVRTSRSQGFRRRQARWRLSAAWLSRSATLVLICLAVVFLESCSSRGGEPITIAITPTTASVDQGQQENFTADLANDLFSQGVTWTLTGTNCVTNGCGTLSNTTTTSVTYTAPAGLASSLSVTLTATSVANTTATKTAAITVELPLQFTVTNTVCSTTPTSAQLPCGSNGVPYSTTIAVTGGVAPYKFALVPGSGGLPAGLTLTQSGVINGTPSGPIAGQPNPAVFTVQVTDNSTQPVTATQQYSISVAPPPPLAITAVSPLQSGFAHAPYSTFIAKTGGVPPFTWSITGGSLQQCSLTFNGSTGQISGLPQAAASCSITVQVKDSALPTSQVAVSGSLSISIQLPTPLSITPSSLPSGTTATPYATALSVTGGIPPYTWTQVSGQLPSGLSFAPGTAEISGTPILATSSTFSVSVSDSEVPPATTSATYTIAVGAGTNSNSLLDGQYSFLFKGFDDNGAVALAGSLLADGNGKITGGGIDSARAPTPVSTGIVLGQNLTGSYSMGTDGRGTMQLIAANTEVIPPVTLTTNYNIALDSEGNIHFFENNSSTADNDPVHTHGTGIMKPANSSGLGVSAFNGNYAFVFSGADLAKSPTALGGVIHADGVSSITPGTGDYNEAGTFSPALALSGTFTFASGTRGGASLTFELPGKTAYTLNYVFDFVSATDLFFVASDPTDATHPRLAGEMILQSPAVEVTTPSALGTPGVATGTGVNSKNASVYAGLLTPEPINGPGCSGQVNCVTLSYDENNGGTIGTPSFTGNFQMSTNGRVTFSNLGPSGTERIAAAYLTGASQGFTIGSDAAVTTGQLDQQEAGVTFTSALVDGGYTLSGGFGGEASVNNVIGEVSAEVSNGTLELIGNPPTNQTVDEFTPPSTPNLGLSLVATLASISPTTGRGTIALNPPPTGLPISMAFYIVSPSSFRAVSTDPADQHPEVFFFDH